MLQTGLLQKPIRSIVKLSPGQIAVGIDGSGVLAYNTGNNSLTQLVNTELAPEFSYTGNGIYALKNDSHGNLWIGSYTGGVTMLSLSPSPLQIITHVTNNANSLVNNNVNHIIESSDGNIWYATDCGISIYNPRTGNWNNSLSGVVVVSLCEDGQGNILAGCYGEGCIGLTCTETSKDTGPKTTEHCHRTISLRYRPTGAARFG